MEVVHLKPDRHLLNPDFEGYKLSLDGLPQYPRSIDNGVDHVRASEDQYSYLHATLFGTHNHLIPDPWASNTVYCIDKAWNVVKLAAGKGSVEEVSTVWEIPSHTKRVSGHYNPSLHFLDPHVAAASDGAGTLHIVNTGERQAAEWKVLWSGDGLGEGISFVIVDGIVRNDGAVVDLLLYRVSELKNVPEWTAEDDTKSEFLSSVDWITLSQNENSDSWSTSRIRRLAGVGTLSYAAIQPDGENIILGGNHRFQFIYDSEKAIEKEEEKKAAEEKPSYAWMQKEDEVMIWLCCTSDVSKEDVDVVMERDRIRIEVKKHNFVLEGNLGGKIDIETSTWTLLNDKLQFTLFRLESDVGSRWQEGIVGVQGEEVINPQLAEEIHQRLAHLTSSTLNSNADVSEKSFNVGDLEECDILPTEDEASIYRLNGESHKVTQKVLLGSSQLLWTSCRVGDTLPEVCIRHDVDGLVWCPKEQWSHVATHHAFGYVQASKTNKKFALGATDHSYAVICDESKHVYVYRQPSKISSDLRNRKSGQRVTEIARQLVISLVPSDSEVLGLHAAENYLFVLLPQTLIAIHVN